MEIFLRVGSSPTVRTRPLYPWDILGQNGRLAQLARASRLHREGRGFESFTAHHAAVAHVVERSSEKAEVASASLARGTKQAGVV